MKIRYLQNTTSKLVRAAQRQNQRAQSLLFEKYAPKMLGVCRSYLKQMTWAEDALSEGFYKAFTRINQLQNPERFESWLRRIIVNEALNVLRKQSMKQPTNELNDVLGTVVTEEIPNQMGYSDLQQLIDQLPSNYKAVFLLAVVEGYRHEEIAQKLNISVASSKVQLHRAKKHLQKRIHLTQSYEKKLS